MKNQNLSAYLFARFGIHTPQEFDKWLSDNNDFYVNITKQNILDKVQIVLHQLWGIGEERQKEFHDAYEEFTIQYQKLIDEDLAVCKGKKKDLDYSSHVLDRLLKEACGKYFVPWEERYHE